MLARENRLHGGKAVAAILCPPEISHVLSGQLTRAPGSLIFMLIKPTQLTLKTHADGGKFMQKSLSMMKIIPTLRR
jgi:hypothetical protein